MPIDLYQRSIQIILANQGGAGGYLACPNFPTYRYCWFRDGSFIAYAMDLSGQRDSAARFHQWATGVVLRRADLVQRAIDKVGRGESLGNEDLLHTRYTLAGEVSGEEWPNFQLDGFGTWLWALAEHRRMHAARLPEEWLRAAALVGKYLAALWHLPCSDLWEENADQVHPYTLAAIYAGLGAEMTLNGNDHTAVLDEIQTTLLSRGVYEGHFTKSIGSKEVDASLIALSVPYHLVELDHPLMLATIDNIASGLRMGGGVHRFRQDTYYGGGEWVLLTAWLGWYYTRSGRKRDAQELLEWVEACAGENGELAEQIPHSLNDPVSYEPWRQRWGDIAQPLLWSHAMYIILRHALKTSGEVIWSTQGPKSAKSAKMNL